MPSPCLVVKTARTLETGGFIHSYSGIGNGDLGLTVPEDGFDRNASVVTTNEGILGVGDEIKQDLRQLLLVAPDGTRLVDVDVPANSILCP